MQVITYELQMKGICDILYCIEVVILSFSVCFRFVSFYIQPVTKLLLCSILFFLAIQAAYVHGS